MPVHLLTAIHKDTKLEKHISEVPSGLECDCICPWCQEELIAKHGSKEQIDYKKPFSDHFAHHHNNECFESQVHSLAEEIVNSNSYINLPGLSYTKYSFAKREYRIGDQWINNYIQTDQFDIAIEITIGEQKNKKKLKWLKNQKDLYSLLIHLEPDDYPLKVNSKIGRRRLAKALLVNGRNKIWLKKPDIPGDQESGSNVISQVFSALRDINIRLLHINK